MNPVHPHPRPPPPLRTSVRIAAGVVLAVLVLGSALIGAGGDGSSDTSTDPGCRTEFFDSGSITTCGDELLYTDDSGNGYSSGG